MPFGLFLLGSPCKTRIFLLIDLQELFSDIGSGDGGGSPEMTSQLVIFSRTNSKTSKVNQQHV